MSEDLNIARCQEGDREAFRVLVDRHKDVLYGTALFMTGNRAVAEEAVQEAFLSGLARHRRLQARQASEALAYEDPRKRSPLTEEEAGNPDDPHSGLGRERRSIGIRPYGGHRESRSRATGAGHARPTATTGGSAQVFRGAYSARNIRSDGSEGGHGQIASAQGLEPPAGTLGGVRIGEGRR